MSTDPHISLVIPARNEEGYLPRLLDTVETAHARYRLGSAAIEVIVADNASTDRTADIARERHCIVVEIEKRVIAAVRNGGAAIARGEILCFVDADMQIHPETFNVIEQTLETGKVIAGATGVRLERWSAGIAVTWAMLVPFALLLRIDTGVVFCRRADFEAIGGYDERRLFAEDVDFLLRMRRLGRSRRQRLARSPAAKAIASTRKFDRHGEWHYFRDIARLGVVMLFDPHATSDFVQRYWYGDER